MARFAIHQFSVRFQIPPHESQVGIHHCRAGVHMTNDALARGNGGCESMLDRMTGFRTWYRGISRVCCKTAISKPSIRSRMNLGAVVGIHHVARRTPTGTVVPRMVVGPHEVERGIQQAGFLQPDENGVGPIRSSQSAITQTSAWLAGFLESFGDPDIGYETSSGFENPQNVAGLADLKSRQWFQVWQNPLLRRFLRSRCGDRLQPLWRAVHAVALAIAWPLVGNRTVVVQRRAPQHATVSHHAFLDRQRLLRMATRCATAQMSHPQIAGVYKANELRTLVIEHRVGSHRVGGTVKHIGKPGRDMCLVLVARGGVTTVTIHASQLHRSPRVGIVSSPMTDNTASALVVHRRGKLTRSLGWRHFGFLSP